MGRPPKPPHERYRTPPSSFRIPTDVKRAAQRAADERGETLTDAVVRFLERYGKDHRD
jgi:antitoxin component of RelBE/YafQ-DinJ toxin-antitoxin module